MDGNKERICYVKKRGIFSCFKEKLNLSLSANECLVRYFNPFYRCFPQMIFVISLCSCNFFLSYFLERRTYSMILTVSEIVSNRENSLEN